MYHNRRERTNRGKGPIGGLVNLIGQGIGLAHEAHAARRKEKLARKNEDPASHTDTGSPVAAPSPSRSVQRAGTMSSPPPYTSAEVPTRSAPEEKKDPDSVSIGTDPGSDVPSDDEDETDWLYDDVQEQANVTAATTTVSFGGAASIDDVVKFFLSAHPPQPSGNRMASPVVLPQRRPNTRRRGFIRGYAPCLEECNVNQVAFMDFLSAFDRAVDISPWFYTVNLAMVAAHANPQLSEALAVQVCRESERRLHMAGEPSTFINKLNTAYFKPNGLYCYVMSWKPYSPHYSETVNMAKGELKVLMSNDKTRRTLLDSLQGDTDRAKMVQLPRAAELIFPDVAQMTEAQKQEGAAKAGGFYKDYADRVAQAKWNRKNPNSPFAIQPQFASRYSDPNHPARSGSLFALITGGALSPSTRYKHARDMRSANAPLYGASAYESHAYPQTQHGSSQHGPPQHGSPPYDSLQQGPTEKGVIEQGIAHQSPSEKQAHHQHDLMGAVHGPKPRQRIAGGPFGLAVTGVKLANRALKEDVLYLMVVNMPNETELEEAAAILERGPPPEYA